MPDTCPTVTIEGQNKQPLDINLSDYDEKKHILFQPEGSYNRKVLTDFLDSKNVKYVKNISKDKLEVLYTETLNTLSISNFDGKFFIVNGEDKRIGEEDFETLEEAEEMLKMFVGK